VLPFFLHAPWPVRDDPPGSADTDPSTSVEDVLFGYRLPHLPGSLVSPRLAGASDRERIGEAVARQMSLILSLGAFADSSFSLRYLYQPAQRSIDIGLLARCATRVDHTRAGAEDLASRLEAALTSFDLPVEALSTRDALLAFLDPIAEPFVVEIRQHEEIAPLRLGDAYAVHPFRASATTWLAAFEMLVRQRHACVISVYLEPTHLTAAEQSSFAEAAAIPESRADCRDTSLPREQHLPDRQARLVSRLYAEALHRFTRPFLLVAQVASADPLTATALARAFAAEICERVTPGPGADSGERLPSNFDLVQPRTLDEVDCARSTLTRMHLSSWGATLATPGKERLRYLADAETASAAFRFPVALRGGVPGVRVQQTAPSFDVRPRPDLGQGTPVSLGSFVDGRGEASLPLHVFAGHTLVAGTRGSGKTTTCFHLLSQLWACAVPFLVIEPAGMDYRTLLRGPFGDRVQVFTLGDETTSPFRLNPLEILPGTRVGSHISAVRASLASAFPMIGPLPSVLEQALHNIYLRKRWELTAQAEANDAREMPTLTDLYFELVRLTEHRGYAGEILQHARDAVARVGSLLRGSTGRMLDTRRSTPVGELLSRPTVLELESLNDDDKALVMLFLLTALREQCRATRTDGRLQHVTLVEEAHRALHAGNRDIGDLLSEMRTAGEAVIIAEEMPGRFAEDVLENTNIRLIHRPPGEDERGSVAARGNADPGVAAVSAPGFEPPRLVRVPDYRSAHTLPSSVPDSEIVSHIRDGADRPFQGCTHCRRVCAYRDRVAMVAYDVERVKRANAAIADFMATAHTDPHAAWQMLVDTSRDALGVLGLDDDPDAAYCYFSHISSRPISAAAADAFRQVALLNHSG